jgi:hypothetical protein
MGTENLNSRSDTSHNSGMDATLHRFPLLRGGPFSPLRTDHGSLIVNPTYQGQAMQGRKG